MDKIKQYKKPSLFKKANGWLRLFVWGVCPECNHDAPELYGCEICDYYNELPRYKSEQTKEQKLKIWNKFIYNDK